LVGRGVRGFKGCRRDSWVIQDVGFRDSRKVWMILESMFEMQETKVMMIIIIEY
jgi:hypothetical protein